MGSKLISKEVFELMTIACDVEVISSLHDSLNIFIFSTTNPSLASAPFVRSRLCVVEWKDSGNRRFQGSHYHVIASIGAQTFYALELASTDTFGSTTSKRLGYKSLPPVCQKDNCFLLAQVLCHTTPSLYVCEMNHLCPTASYRRFSGC